MARKQRPPDDTTFLPHSITRAADEAAEQVLAEDRLLRRHGIAPAHGRSF